MTYSGMKYYSTLTSLDDMIVIDYNYFDVIVSAWGDNPDIIFKGNTRNEGRAKGDSENFGFTSQMSMYSCLQHDTHGLDLRVC